MSYKLEYPYTEEERANFIVEYNHQKELKIETIDNFVEVEIENFEDETIETRVENRPTYFALEKNEILVNGKVVLNPTFEQEQEEIAKQQRNTEIDSKIQELQIMALPEVLNGNIENIKLYNDVIAGLENARP